MKQVAPQGWDNNMTQKSLVRQSSISVKDSKATNRDTLRVILSEECDTKEDEKGASQSKTRGKNIVATGTDGIVIGARVGFRVDPKKRKCGETPQERGWIRYYGAVATSKNPKTMWVGVEWDAPGRGKHDGAVMKDGQEYRYFTCEDGQGSFVKPKKLHFSRSFWEAVIDAYGPGNVDAARALTDDANGMDVDAVGPNSNLQIEFVGWEEAVKRQGNFPKKKTIGLQNECVSSIASVENLQTLKNLRELNLAHNLFTDWHELFNLRHIPNLKRLYLSDNKFLPQLDPSVLKGSFDNLETLSLNDAPGGWYFALEMAEVGGLPNLTTLRLNMNGYTGFTRRNGDPIERLECFDGLLCIELNDNKFTTWSSLGFLQYLPNLECIKVNRNYIQNIEYNEGTFPSIKTFWARENEIKSLRDIENLGKYQGIDDLLLRVSPLEAQYGPTITRDVIIAVMPERLRLLNSCHVQKFERKDAAMSYARFARKCYAKLLRQREEQKMDGTLEAIERMFPRLEEYEKIYGRVQEAEVSKSHMDVVTVTISSMDPRSCTAKSRKKKLPVAMTCLQLKQFCKRIFKLRPEHQLLTYMNPGSGKQSIPKEMTDDDWTLDYYAIKDGTHIYMNSKEDYGKSKSNYQKTGRVGDEEF